MSTSPESKTRPSRGRKDVPGVRGRAMRLASALVLGVILAIVPVPDPARTSATVTPNLVRLVRATAHATNECVGSAPTGLSQIVYVNPGQCLNVGWTSPYLVDCEMGFVRPSCTGSSVSSLAQCQSMPKPGNWTWDCVSVPSNSIVSGSVYDRSDCFESGSKIKDVVFELNKCVVADGAIGRFTLGANDSVVFAKHADSDQSCSGAVVGVSTFPLTKACSPGYTADMGPAWVRLALGTPFVQALDPDLPVTIVRAESRATSSCATAPRSGGSQVVPVRPNTCATMRIDELTSSSAFRVDCTNGYVDDQCSGLLLTRRPLAESCQSMSQPGNWSWSCVTVSNNKVVSGFAYASSDCSGAVQRDVVVELDRCTVTEARTGIFSLTDGGRAVSFVEYADPTCAGPNGNTTLFRLESCSSGFPTKTQGTLHVKLRMGVPWAPIRTSSPSGASDVNATRSPSVSAGLRPTPSSLFLVLLVAVLGLVHAGWTSS